MAGTQQLTPNAGPFPPVSAWIRLTRPMFLLGSILLAVAGTALAWWDGFFDLRLAALAFVGLLLWHLSVNVLNEYFDYRSGVDFHAERTAFSGGSGLLPGGVLRARSALALGAVCFVLALPAWGYLAVEKGFLLVALLVPAAGCVLLYTPLLTKLGLGELSSAYGVGVFPILAFYFIQTGFLSLEALALALVAAALVGSLHLLNEFPDVEADRVGGRRTLAIVLGRRGASWVNLGVALVGYGLLVGWVVAGLMPREMLMALVTLPIAGWVAIRAFRYRSPASFSPVLWASGAAYTLTLLLLAGGYIADGI